MAQIFHRSANTLSRATIFGAVFIAGFILWVIGGIVRSPYFTNQGIHREQPVPFSHQHHVAGLGIDCRYCHTSVETSSFRSGKPIVWSRVHRLPDFVHFNHGIHVNKGIGCASCHGRVDKMNLIYQASPLTMEWCLNCHRAPEKHIRPRDQVFNMAYVTPPNQDVLGPQLVKAYNVQKLTSCSVCHY
jgi:hypothetical protein